QSALATRTFGVAQLIDQPVCASVHALAHIVGQLCTIDECRDGVRFRTMPRACDRLAQRCTLRQGCDKCKRDRGFGVPDRGGFEFSEGGGHSQREIIVDKSTTIIHAFGLSYSLISS